jgi:hypothetical protein
MRVACADQLAALVGEVMVDERAVANLLAAGDGLAVFPSVSHSS